ncbi:hypothetical protein ACFL4T_05950 [candidate division KSB1 bacterium]
MKKKFLIILILTQILLINSYHFCHEDDLNCSFEESRLTSESDNGHHDHYSIDHSGVHNFLIKNSGLTDFSKLKFSLHSFLAVSPEYKTDNFVYISHNYVKIVSFIYDEHLPVYLKNSSLII